MAFGVFVLVPPPTLFPRFQAPRVARAALAPRFPRRAPAWRVARSQESPPALGRGVGMVDRPAGKNRENCGRAGRATWSGDVRKEPSEVRG